MNQINKKQIKDLNNLYDIKTLSQIITDKGWACISKNNDTILDRNSSVFKDIESKYNNIPFTPTSLTKGIDLYNARNVTYFKNNYWLNNDSDNLYVTNDITEGNVATEIHIGDGTFRSNFVVGDNIMLATKVNNMGVYKIVDVDNVQEVTIPESWNATEILWGCKHNGYIYLTLPYGDGWNPGSIIYKIRDDASATEIETVVTFDYYIKSIIYVDNLWYIVTNNGIYIATDIEDTSTYELKYEQQDFDGITIFYSEDLNRFVIISAAPFGDYPIYVSDDNFETLNRYDLSLNRSGNIIPVQYNNSLYVWGGDNWGSSYHIRYQTFENITQSWNYEEFGDVGPVYSFFGRGYTSVICCNNEVYYQGYHKQIRTDVINNISINYYLDEDSNTKIILNPNQENINKVKQYLGYFNYFILNLVNKTVVLPYNSNLWTYMYVSDDYQETLSNIPKGDYSIFATKKDLNNILSKINNYSKAIVKNDVLSFTSEIYEDERMYFTPKFNITDIFTADSWEIHVKFKYLGRISNFATIATMSIAPLGESIDYQGFSFGIENGDICLFLSSDGNGWDIASKTSTDTQISLNEDTIYDFKLQYTGAQYNLYAKSENDNDYILLQNIDDPTKIGTSNNNASTIIYGNNCYTGNNYQLYADWYLRYCYLDLNNQIRATLSSDFILY